MINLIPKEEKKRMVQAFYYRLVVLFLLMAGFVALLFFVSILPTYFLSSVKDNVITAKLEAQKNEPVPIPDQKTLAVINDLNTKLGLIEHSKQGFLLSKNVISAILLKKSAKIKITDIAYDNDVAKGKKIVIQGTAPSREVLLLFRQALEEDASFKQVNLPISNFVKGSDIQFNLTLIPA